MTLHHKCLTPLKCLVDGQYCEMGFQFTVFCGYYCFFALLSLTTEDTDVSLSDVINFLLKILTIGEKVHLKTGSIASYDPCQREYY